MIGGVIITDGRPGYLPQMLATLRADERPAVFVVVDDSGNPDNAAIVRRLTAELDPVYVIHEERRGLAAAVQSGWAAILRHPVEYVLHLEDDFTFPNRIPLKDMRRALEAYPFLSQVVLKRQPWNAEEMAAGGIIEANPGGYFDYERDGPPVVLHREIFSLNPCLIPRRVVEVGWPNGNEAEQTERLLRPEPFKLAPGRFAPHPPPDPFAFYGTRADPPRCIHIGARRAAAWTL